MYKLSTYARTAQMLLLAFCAGVCVQTLHAQSKEAATVIELEGQVSVMRSGLVPLFAKGTPGSPVAQWGVRPKEEIVTGSDGHAVFQISDGSTFEVFPNSRVTFQGEWTFEDMLQLILGKIRVQVEHRNGPNHKKVQTPTAVISVRGTVFDVEVQDDDGTTYVAVEEGQVVVQHRLKPGNTKTLNQNESLMIYANQPLAQAKSSGPGVAFWWDRAKNAMADIILNNPGGVIGGKGGSIPGTTSGGGAQGDGHGKNPKPPANPVPNPGGGN